MGIDRDHQNFEFSLKSTFEDLLKNYTNDLTVINGLWTEIETAHTSKKRHYHSLDHLAHLLEEVKEVSHLLQDKEAVLFTLFYHDIVYNATRKDNEEKSADIAKKRMNSLGVSPSKIARTYKQIIATKSHEVQEDKDANYFTDADLSILGQSWETYEVYFQNVRKEYAMYPDLLYGPGRKKVLRHFLEMKYIFKTTVFRERYEVQARENLKNELHILTQ